MTTQAKPVYGDHDLTARWSKRENDILIGYPCGPDGHLLYGVFGKSFTDELVARGYDITTLCFRIKRFAKSPTDPQEPTR